MEDKLVKHFTDSIYYELEKTARVLRLLGVQMFEKIDAGLGGDEHAALDTISCNPNICQRDLAKLILKDRANTGKIINSLEEKKLIERCIDTKNNRLVKKVKITEKGEETLAYINNQLEKMFNEQRTNCKINLDDIEKVQCLLKRLRLSFEELIDMKI
ncbi:MarR family transcriptional regulator [Spirochaetes bacterium]|uniref:MarR family transcriptional regulator n=1 Tax=Candidatus Scatousia excrementipullorum TaxID=2840936 RepID=A0A9D9GZW9_9BACT|nr:MarR family transcriptional regulator [Candidatus Scatousia excrementipullorum]